MHPSLVSCKNEEDQINKEGARVITTLFIVFFFRCSRAVNSVVSGRIWLKFELTQAFMHVLVSRNRNSVANYPKFDLIQAFMHVLLTCKNGVDQIKNERARVFTRFLPL